MIECPFCGEIDFDLIGLKAHLLNGDCEEFAHTLSPLEEVRRHEQGRSTDE
jgi:hypothetical protein